MTAVWQHSTINCSTTHFEHYIHSIFIVCPEDCLLKFSLVLSNFHFFGAKEIVIQIDRPIFFPNRIQVFFISLSWTRKKYDIRIFYVINAHWMCFLQQLKINWSECVPNEIFFLFRRGDKNTQPIRNAKFPKYFVREGFAIIYETSERRRIHFRHYEKPCKLEKENVFWFSSVTSSLNVIRRIVVGSQPLTKNTTKV